MFACEVVNVKTSPTSYFVPASSIATPSTEPTFILSTFASAKPLPTLVSTVMRSPSEYKIPPSETAPDDTIPLIVNDMDTSWTVEIAVTVSPLVNVPTNESGLICNSAIVTPAWLRVDTSITLAVAPEVPPVIFCPIISVDIELALGVVLRSVCLSHLPSEAFIIYLFG